MEPRPLRNVDDEGRYGGKATQLGAALRAGLPVPDGFALPYDAVEAVAAGEGDACARVARLAAERTGPVAVRSSAVGEDGAGQSFAGQHLSVLNVLGAEAVIEAVRAVHASGRTDAARAYRRRMGVQGDPRVAVVVQSLVDPSCAGVMFTRDPMTGADVRVIEAAWGLGESVVQGLVTPDRFRLSRGGAILERHAGLKDLAVRRAPGGGTLEAEVDAADATRLCLDDAQLAQLARLADGCESAFGPGRDIEWAFADGAIVLLQVRAITVRGRGA